MSKVIKNEKVAEFRLNGDIIHDEDAEIYEWYGYACITPKVVHDSLAMAGGKDVVIWLNSYGGNTTPASEIYTAIRNYQGQVRILIDGIAASAASLIAMAADTLCMSPTAQLMIHNPWTSAAGDAKDMSNAAQMLESVKASLIKAYESKTGLSQEELSAMMDKETFISADEALKAGFIDEILFDSIQTASHIVTNMLNTTITDEMRGEYRKIQARAREEPSPETQEQKSKREQEQIRMELELSM